jgi:hypothetical protein
MYQVVAALERVKNNPAVFQCRQLVLAGTTPFARIEVADIGSYSPLEITCGHHPVTTVIAFPAQYKDLVRFHGKRPVSECPPRTFHQLDIGNTQCGRIYINRTHPGRTDYSCLQKSVNQFRSHC